MNKNHGLIYQKKYDQFKIRSLNFRMYLRVIDTCNDICVLNVFRSQTSNERYARKYQTITCELIGYSPY